MRVAAILIFLLGNLALYSQPLGKVIALEGSESYLQLPKLQTPPTDEVTIALWAQSENWEEIPGLAGLIGNLEYGGFSIDVSQHQLRARVMREGYRWTAYNTRLLLPGWHHLAMTYDGSQLALFVDGILRSRTDFDKKMEIIYPEEEIPLLLGAELGEEGKPQTATFFAGYIDQVAVYDQALTPEQIRSHLTNDNIGPIPVLSVSFDECQGVECSEETTGKPMLSFGSPKVKEVLGSDSLRSISNQTWPKALMLFISALGLMLVIFKTEVHSRNKQILIVACSLWTVSSLLHMELFMSEYISPFWTPRDCMFLSSLSMAVTIFLFTQSSLAFRRSFLIGSISIAFAGTLTYTLPHSYLSILWVILVLLVNIVFGLWLRANWNRASNPISLLVLPVLLDISWVYWSYVSPTIQNPLMSVWLPAVVVLFLVLLALRNAHLFEIGLQLSAREKEVSTLLVEGLTDQEIADKLFVSFNTSRTHIRKIYKKLGVSNRVEAIRELKKHLS